MNDDRLRERFRALREQEARDAPDFEATLRARPAAPGRRPLRWALATATVLALAALLWPRAAEPPAAAEGPAIRWSMPSDVLLELPGAELLRGLPPLGSGIAPGDTGRRIGTQKRRLT